MNIYFRIDDDKLTERFGPGKHYLCFRRPDSRKFLRLLNRSTMVYVDEDGSFIAPEKIDQDKHSMVEIVFDHDKRLERAYKNREVKRQELVQQAHDEMAKMFGRAPEEADETEGTGH